MNEVASLEYASPKRRRRAWPWSIAALILAAVAILTFAGPRWASLTQWLSDVSDRRTILRGAASTGTLDLTLPVAAQVNPSPAMPLYQRIAAWTKANERIRFDLENLLSPRPTSRHGDPGAMWIGRLRASDGQERLAVISANVMVLPERSMLLLRFSIDLSAIGTVRAPAFVPLKTSADAKLREFTPGVYESHRWLGVDVRFTAGDAISLGSPAIDPADPSTIRFPITVRGEADELLLTLKPGDRIDVRRASGRSGRFDAQPTTTRSAA